MAGPVKGTIGNEEVVLNDAATETTLLKLLAAVQKVELAVVAQAEAALKKLRKTLWLWLSKLVKPAKSLKNLKKL